MRVVETIPVEKSLEGNQSPIVPSWNIIYTTTYYEFSPELSPTALAASAPGRQKTPARMPKEILGQEGGETR